MSTQIFLSCQNRTITIMILSLVKIGIIGERDRYSKVSIDLEKVVINDNKCRGLQLLNRVLEIVERTNRSNVAGNFTWISEQN